ncbi:hypothetical protein GE061_005930 [Apolygus lucorum]|uniref:Ferritin/DPS domain-containing protein n=1 Tax=Apolygus lucorum TaxID=248454 RepID=A0A8S9WSB5_APOLU|nr:hypothetical protein GE061_005930 [Apolygus lucorum]
MIIHQSTSESLNSSVEQSTAYPPNFEIPENKSGGRHKQADNRRAGCCLCLLQYGERVWQRSVALPGFHELFKEFSNEELQHANHWIDYMNLRGEMRSSNRSKLLQTRGLDSTLRRCQSDRHGD